MSLFLRNQIEKRRAEHAALQAEQERQKENRRHELRAERDRERRRLAPYVRALSQRRKEHGERLRHHMSETYWKWWRALPTAERQRDWKLRELMPVFNNNAAFHCSHMRVGPFLRLMGWRLVHLETGSVWRSPESPKQEWWTTLGNNSEK